MNEPESVGAALEAAANHPTVQKAVAAGTVVMGSASLLSNVQTVLGLISLAIGCLVGAVVLRNSWIQGKLLQRKWERGEDIDEVKS